jgi:hypothetical protein
MTERGWLRSNRPLDLLALLVKRQASQRKLRLFAVACSRRYEFNTEAEAEAEEADAENRSERFADGLATVRELARRKSWWVADSDAVAAASFFCNRQPFGRDLRQSEKAALFREIFSNPFRPAAFDPVRITPAVVSLAHAAYAERIGPYHDLDGVRLAILADALEESGCADDTMLSHLRSSGPHVRGCWAVDLCLNRD